MKIIHISDFHFGPYHWAGNDERVLERINAFAPDMVFNTGDMTTDSQEKEFQQSGDFLAGIECENILSIFGNHDKFSRSSHDFFRKYIYDGDFIEPKDKTKIKKPRVYMNEDVVTLDGYFYETNFVRTFDINNQKIMVVAIDTCTMHKHHGLVEEQSLAALSDVIKATPHDRAIMMTHHSVLSADNEALDNSKRVTDFIVEHKIEANFCGHTHEVDMVEVKDIINNHTYRQFMSGSMSSRTILRESNMYCSYENFGAEDEKITITRMYPEGDDIRFEDTVIERNPRPEQSQNLASAFKIA